MRDGAHQFAFFIAALPEEQSIVLTDSELVHRIVGVLRCIVGDSLILFSSRVHAVAEITEITSRLIKLRLGERQSHAPLAPFIDLVLPLLDRQALESAVASATCLGVRKIYLVRTHKSAPLAVSPSLENRLQRIMIAAAEQSKQFCMPEIITHTSFEKSLVQSGSENLKIFLHPTGKSILEYLPAVQQAKQITLIVGPAGDLTSAEQDALCDAGVLRLQLTPTVLRAEDAVMVGAGLLRSVLR